MKITKINIPKDNTDGLEEIKMDKLSKVVLITGKNGSGKTRILNKIFYFLRAKKTRQQIEGLNSDLRHYFSQLEASEANLAHHKNELKISIQSNFDSSNIISVIAKYESEIEGLKNTIEIVQQQIDWNSIETDILGDLYTCVKFVPKSQYLINPSDYSKSQLIEKAQAGNIGVELLHETVFAKIQHIQDKYYNVTHPNTHTTLEEKQKAITDYEKLQNLIRIFFGTEITRTINDEATLYGFPLGQSNLSDGQKVLMQFCMALYSQELELKDLILVMDEPENHLHPSVIIETIERISAAVTNGQIWIVTHSIPLLAHFDPSNIWFVEKGKISYAGKTPERVLESLLGDENEIAKLQDFISLPSQFATNRYAFESLFEPNAVMTDFKDPQVIQINNELQQLTKNGSLKILDYGAGKGRLISNIYDLDSLSQSKVIKLIDYIAYDGYSNDKVYCENSIAKIYGSSENRYFNEFNSLFSVHDKHSFDVVIMCNVLHEIDPKDWLGLFAKNGRIADCLSDNGVLILVEDQQIPVGEKAYQKGFLVLDTPQLKELFKITQQDSGFKFTDVNNDGRLKLHQISKRLLTNIDEESRKRAISSISQLAKEKIIEIRKMEKNYKNGKLHGFWTQQFANAQLCLSELTVI